jgi:hypothetical protein
MFEHSISENIGIVAFLLAIFAVGLQYIPIEFYFQYFRHRKPTQGEVLMIKKLLGITSLVSLILVLFWGVITIIDMAFSLANSFPANQLQRNIIGSEIILISIGVLAYFIVLAWKASKRISIEPIETEKIDNKMDILVTKIDKLIDIESKSIQSRDTLDKKITELINQLISKGNEHDQTKN